MAKEAAKKVESDTAIEGSKIQDLLVLDQVVSDDEFAQYAGAGLEEVSGTDITVARLVILQALSPTCLPGHAKHIKGAAQGMMINTLTREIYDVNEQDPLVVVPVYFNVRYIVWRPREVQGGGIVSVLDRIEGAALERTTTRNAKNQNILPDGNILVQTNQHFVVVYEPTTGNMFKAIISMSSTALKYSRSWLGVIDNQKMVIKGKNVKLPSFARMYQVRTGLEQKGDNLWASWNITLLDSPGVAIPKSLFDEATEFYNLMKAGVTIVGADEDSHDGGSMRPDNSGLSDEMPY